MPGRRRWKAAVHGGPIESYRKDLAGQSTCSNSQKTVTPRAPNNFAIGKNVTGLACRIYLSVNGHPVYRTHGPGPMVALVDFLASGSGRVFERDRLRDHQFGFTF